MFCIKTPSCIIKLISSTNVRQFYLLKTEEIKKKLTSNSRKEYTVSYWQKFSGRALFLLCISSRFFFFHFSCFFHVVSIYQSKLPKLWYLIALNESNLLQNLVLHPWILCFLCCKHNSVGTQCSQWPCPYKMHLDSSQVLPDHSGQLRSLLSATHLWS